MWLLKFLWLAIRPISKAEPIYGWYEVFNLIPYIAYPLVPIFTKWASNFDFIWFVGIPTLLFLIAGIKLQYRLDKNKKKIPKLKYRLLPFPQSGTRIVRGDDIFKPQEGYAKIAVSNSGGMVNSCIGTVCSISKINELKGEIKPIPLIFTARQLEWDSGETEKTIPNDGVERYLNLAHLNQEEGDKWQLAVMNSEDYFYGWHKIDIVISSLSTQMEPIKIEVALALGARDDPPSGLNLWPWDKWYSTRQKELQRELDKEDSQT